MAAKHKGRIPIVNVEPFPRATRWMLDQAKLADPESVPKHQKQDAMTHGKALMRQELGSTLRERQASH